MSGVLAVIPVRMAASRLPGKPLADIAGLPRPIAGYVGGLHQWVDQELIVEVARRLPHVTFAFVGPAQCDLAPLEACPNVTLLGGKPHAELPSYIREFDIYPKFNEVTKRRFSSFIPPTRSVIVAPDSSIVDASPGST